MKGMVLADSNEEELGEIKEFPSVQVVLLTLCEQLWQRVCASRQKHSELLHQKEMFQ